jgi:hypothetical protein
LHPKGKTSRITLSRIQELESLGFEWNCYAATWEGRLSELADYRKTHGHCNVPKNYSENLKLGLWVETQRTQYNFHVKGKRSDMTLSRIRELESVGFEWHSRGAAWEDRLSELANYRKIHGHCNVPYNYSENLKLGKWVAYQRQQYRLHVEEKRSQMTLSRIQELESLGFEWKRLISHGKGAPKKAHAARSRGAVEAQGHMQQHSLKKISALEYYVAIKSRSLSKNPTGMAKMTLPTSRVKPQKSRRLAAGGAEFDETGLDGSIDRLQSCWLYTNEHQWMIVRSQRLERMRYRRKCRGQNTSRKLSAS